MHQAVWYYQGWILGGQFSYVKGLTEAVHASPRPLPSLPSRCRGATVASSAEAHRGSAYELRVQLNGACVMSGPLHSVLDSVRFAKTEAGALGLVVERFRHEVFISRARVAGGTWPAGHLRYVV